MIAVTALLVRAGIIGAGAYMFGQMALAPLEQLLTVLP
jgi:hypothetical protein